MSDFTSKVLEIVKKIPKGKTLSYKQVAEKAGSPKASRAVGSILKKNFREDVPCHRVIKSNGEAGEYNRGNLKKVIILRKEGALS
ncbi:MAG: methylated-DNA-[protein]-cysteine S-methyltransferase [Patescibacteria group bacterium]|jgi:O-6-methylguanine DNA methyltransferase|nr:methylated-DNA-[protein]-cysteine S-methyltransferase [Patescibacteria group bacterium]